jgi:charged multivesicular body protein 5
VFIRSAATSLKQRAMQVLKQKRMYEQQRTALMGQQFNIDQTRFAQDNMKDQLAMIGAMKETHVAMKEQFQEFSIEEIEDLHDDMADLMEDTQEINDILARSYGVPDEINEEDLEAEFGALEEELALDQQSEAADLSSFLVAPSVPTSKVPRYCINVACTSFPHNLFAFR